MEAFFCSFYHFFQQQEGTADRRGADFPQQTQKIGKEIAQLQRPAAEQQEVEHRTAQDAQQHIDAHLAVSGRHCVDEDRRGHGQPEK